MISLKHGGHTLCFTVAGDGDKILNKESCQKYLSDIEEYSFTSFDQLIECVTSLHLIKINDVQWQLSECSCYMWLKNFKCNHVIAVCSRLNLCSFNSIAMNLPLAPKKSRGRMKKRNPALLRDGEVERYALDNDLTVEAFEEEPPVAVPLAAAAPLTRSKTSKRAAVQDPSDEMPAKRRVGRPKKI